MQDIFTFVLTSSRLFFIFFHVLNFFATCLAIYRRLVVVRFDHELWIKENYLNSKPRTSKTKTIVRFISIIESSSIDRLRSVAYNIPAILSQKKGKKQKRKTKKTVFQPEGMGQSAEKIDVESPTQSSRTVWQ